MNSEVVDLFWPQLKRTAAETMWACDVGVF